MEEEKEVRMYTWAEYKTRVDKVVGSSYAKTNAPILQQFIKLISCAPFSLPFLPILPSSSSPPPPPPLLLHPAS